jgi:hypothetical protein
MKFIKSTVLKALGIILLVGISFCVHAQVITPDPGPPEDPPVPDDQPVPITGIEYLLISGGILGGYKLFKNRNKENNQP